MDHRPAAWIVGALVVSMLVLAAAATASVVAGDGERGLDLAANAVAVAVLAGLFRLMWLAPSIEARLDGGELRVRFHRWDVVWTARREVRVPLTQVEAVEVRRPESLGSGWWHRRLGAVLPGVIKAGRFGGPRGPELWDVRGGADVIDVRLGEAAPVRRLVLQVEDPVSLAEAVERAARPHGSPATGEADR